MRWDTGKGGITTLPEQERILVGEELLGLLPGRRHKSVPCVVIHAQENRTAACGGTSEPRSKLRELPRCDARIVEPGYEHHGWICRTRHDVLVGVHRVEGPETRLVRDRTELRNVRRPVRRKLGTQSIADAHDVEGGREQLGLRRDGAPNRDAAGARSFAGEMRRRGVLVIDEPATAGDDNKAESSKIERSKAEKDREADEAFRKAAEADGTLIHKHTFTVLTRLQPRKTLLRRPQRKDGDLVAGFQKRKQQSTVHNQTSQSEQS